jgi:uncharacterized protein (DUF433 family)
MRGKIDRKAKGFARNMSAALQYPHLDVDADGHARIAGSRYKVLHLAGEHYHYGWSTEELLRQHPDLRPEEVYASLTYFYDHYSEMVQQLVEAARQVEQKRGNQMLSREQLLQRGNVTEPS